MNGGLGRSLMDPKTSKTFCILPWIHMHIWPNGITYPCCLATNDYVLGNTNKSSFKELWNSDKMTTLRKNIMSDKCTSGCNRCYEHEAQGSRSMRQNMNMDFEHLIPLIDNTKPDGTLDDINMHYMDIRFSNICNMRCRTCGPELSSQWYDDAVKMNPGHANVPRIHKIKKNLTELWDDMEPWIDTVERIYFAGGEPLIMDEHYKIMEHLLDIGKTDIFISYNTNFSKLTYKRKDAIMLWKQFPIIKVGASLDAMGDRAELMRKGTIWSEIEDNRKRLLDEAPHVEFQISCTVSAYNAEHCIDFFDEWIERGWVTPDKIDINVLLFPEHQRLQILPLESRKRIQAKITDYMLRHNLKKVDINGRSFAAFTAFYNALDEDKTDLAPRFIQLNQTLDGIREEQLVNTFPELSVLY